MLRQENPATTHDHQSSGNIAGYASFEALCCTRPRGTTATASVTLAGAGTVGRYYVGNVPKSSSIYSEELTLNGEAIPLLRYS